MDWRRNLRWMLSLAFPAVALATGCSTLNVFSSKEKEREKVEEKVERPAAGRRADAPALPGQYALRVAPYVFLSDFEVRRDQPLFEELANLRDQVYKDLLLPPGTAVIQVYLFQNKQTYTAYMNHKHKDLPPRRAFFIAQPRMGGEDLFVYTYMSDRIRQDLRHELTHALLHSVIRDVPLWLDEGLAEYFELPPDKKTINADHVDLLRRGLATGAFRPNLARLEGLKNVEDMNPAEYREAWAWVHLMLHSEPEARTALLSYVQQLRTARAPGPLGGRLERSLPDPEKAFKDHLGLLETAIIRQRDAAVRASSAARP